MSSSKAGVGRPKPTPQQRLDLQAELERFVDPEEARQLMTQINDRVMEVDDEIDRILRDPLVSESWEYDGRCFVLKNNGFGLQVAFDGFNILQWLETYAYCFFRFHPKETGIKLIGKELDTFLWLARASRMNWEEEGHLSVVRREVIEAVVADVKERRRAAAAMTPSPLAPEERAFFESYEAELRP